MAKPYRAKPASYYIKVDGENKWAIAKFTGSGGGDGEVPEQTYNLRCETVGGTQGKVILCNCPASFKGYKGNSKQVCKHVGWLERWQSIYERHLVEPDVILYYDSGDDKFHKLEGLMSVC